MIIICTLIASNVLQCIWIYVHSGKKSEVMFQPGPSGLLWMFKVLVQKQLKKFTEEKSVKGY